MKVKIPIRSHVRSFIASCEVITLLVMGAANAVKILIYNEKRIERIYFIVYPILSSPTILTIPYASPARITQTIE